MARRLVVGICFVVSNVCNKDSTYRSKEKERRVREKDIVMVSVKLLPGRSRPFVLLTSTKWSLTTI